MVEENGRGECGHPGVGGDEEVGLTGASDRGVALAFMDLPTLDILQSTLVLTLKWCPKAARGEFARELATLWHRLTEHPDQVHLWCLQAMFARCILMAGRELRACNA